MKTIIIDGIEYNLTPKVLFKKGDFVVIQETTYQITKVENLNVTLSLNGRECLFDIDVLKNAHLWDITKDAKAGDVLADVYGNIGIYKKHDDFDWTSYCSLGNNGGFQPFEIEHENERTYPATKEQRDTLIKAMTDAGYTFDFGRKELKKLKFKVGDCVVNNDSGVIQHIKEIVNVNDETLYVFDEDSVLDIIFQKQYHLWNIGDSKEGDVLAIEPIDGYEFPLIAICKRHGLDFFNSYCFIGFDGKFYKGEGGHALNNVHPATKEQRDLLFSKMNEAGYEWDAEKKKLKEIDSYCQEHCKGYQETGRCFADGECEAKKNAKTGWSKEDKDYYDAIIAKLEVTQDDAALTDNQMNFLKSLKDRIVPQSQQEWDEEDEKMVIALMSICDEWATRHSYLPEENNDIEKIKNWLKSLKPQNHWRPSEEQIDAIRYVVQHYNPNACERLAWNSLKTLEIMCNDLKKL